MGKKLKQPAHVVMGNNAFQCLNCGRERSLSATGGYTINEFAALGEAFEKDHKSCKPSPAGAARFKATTPDEWLASWDTGISSKTIFSVFTGRPFASLVGSGWTRPSVPLDPSDFGRCHRLLQNFPEWRKDLARVAKALPEWAPLVARWSECEALYEVEAPSGKAPKLYDLMKKLIAEGQAVTKDSSP